MTTVKVIKKSQAKKTATPKAATEVKAPVPPPARI